MVLIHSGGKNPSFSNAARMARSTYALRDSFLALVPFLRALCTSGSSRKFTTYALYLTEEGYAAAEIVKIVNAAVDEAGFDLNLMSVVP